MEKFDCDFSRICRACKKETDEMFSVFEPDAETGEPNKLAEMLMTCTTVLVESGDGLPSSICEPCATQLDNAFKFKKQCEITDASLRLYVRKKHIKEEANNTEETGDEVLDFASLYNSEISHIEDVKPEPTDLLEVISKESSMFPCDMCNKRFLTMRLLKSHKRVHSMSFKCKVCDEEFTRSNLLERHMRSHGSQKVHVCKICNKTLTKIEQLKRHMATHVKHKPFSCEKCKKCFSRVDHLANHAKRCKGGRPFVCNICNKGFMREDAMQLHVAGHGTNKAVLETIENYEDHYIQVENYPNSDMDEKSSDSDYFDDGGMNSNTDDKNNLTDTPIQATTVFKTEDLTQQEGAAEMNNHINSIADDSDDDAKPLSERVNQKQKGDDDVPLKRKRGRPRKSDPHCVVQKSKVGEFPCEQCGVIMSTQRRLELHIEKHSDGEAFECKICRKRFTRAIHLKRHFRNHADDKEFQCDLCSEIFDKRDDLIQHNTKEHPSDGMFECDVCSKVFNYFTNLENHKAQKHGEVDDKSPVFKKYKCQICEKAFTTEKYCETHMKSHSNERTWKCETCSKKFKTKSHLTEHTKFHSECARKYLCSECGQRFIRNDYLVIHMRRHRGEKPFKCKYCGKGFPRTTDLTVHERYHTGEKTHLCMVCGRGFGRAYNLTVHMRTHTGEKPYQCTYCDAAFAQGNDLKAHVRRHTGERYHCDLCPEAFLMGYLLTHHKRTVHGVDVRSHIRRLHPHEKVQPGAPPPTAPLMPLIASLPNVLPIPHALVQTEIKLEQPTAPMPMLSADS